LIFRSADRTPLGQTHSHTANDGVRARAIDAGRMHNSRIHSRYITILLQYPERVTLCANF
jgi:hypothetical protein